MDMDPSPLPAVPASDTTADHPKFNKEAIIAKSLIPAQAHLRKSLMGFVSEAVVLLQTVKEEEMLAACNYLDAPNVTNQLPILLINNIRFILGIFGGHKAVLIQTNKGVDCQHEIMPALLCLPNVKLIIGLGFAYGRRSKCNLGDVLVSKVIDGVGNCRIENSTLKFDEGRVRHTSMSTATLSVFAKGTSLWRSFECSKEGRIAKAYSGVLISAPMLLNDIPALNGYLKNNERFIGGEMEGQELAHAQLCLKEQHHRDVDFIIIKGVADYGDGTKEKGWQQTASLAAASYAKHKLLESANGVYFCTEAATPCVHVARAEDSSRTSFKLKIINGHIKQCNGCGIKFRRSTKENLSPPDDLIVAHLEKKKYPDKKSGRLVVAPKPGNVHFHLDIGCIKIKHPNINLSEFAILDSERSKLTDAHKKKLKTLGMIID